MVKALLKYRVFIVGLCAPVAALIFYSVVYAALTRASTDREADWLFRLSASTLAMVVPFLGTIALARMDRRPLSFLAKVGLVIATLSLGLAWKPVSDGINRWKQTRNLAMRDVTAPSFNTVDLLGRTQRLGDEKGKVVLVNIWATWCGPCRAEMPKLDRLYRERAQEGFIVFGLSDEDVAVQQKYVQQFPVSYPLLTLNGEVPSLYRDIARYPAIFLVDRQGKLQPAPSPDQPFAALEAVVDRLLKDSP